MSARLLHFLSASELFDDLHLWKGACVSTGNDHTRQAIDQLAGERAFEPSSFILYSITVLIPCESGPITCCVASRRMHIYGAIV